jgi:hypothetical protein
VTKHSPKVARTRTNAVSIMNANLHFSFELCLCEVLARRFENWLNWRLKYCIPTSPITHFSVIPNDGLHWYDYMVFVTDERMTMEQWSNSNDQKKQKCLGKKFPQFHHIIPHALTSQSARASMARGRPANKPRHGLPVYLYVGKTRRTARRLQSCNVERLLHLVCKMIR